MHYLELLHDVDMSSSISIDNRGKDILILRKGFAKVNAKFYFSLYYNGEKSYLFVNGTDIHKFTAKDFKIVPYNLCLGNVSKDFLASNMKKTGFNAYIYDFSADYNSTDVIHIKETQKYLMKKD